MKNMPNEYDKIDQFSDYMLEDAVIGACLIGNQEAVSEMIANKITAAHFTQKRAAITFQTISGMFERGETVDLLTVNHILHETENVPNITPYLMKTTERICSSVHIAAYCKQLNELYIKRETSALGGELAMAGYQNEQDGILDKIQTLTNELMNKKYEADIQPVANSLEASALEMQNRIRLAATGELAGITTGLTELNDLTNGWQKSTLNIIAGRPGMGKTSIALHFALAAARQGKNVCIYSLEMSSVRLVDRLIMAIAENMNDTNFRNGQMTDNDLRAFQIAQAKLAKLPIFIDDNPNCTTNYIRANAKKMQKRNQCDMIVVDYLQLTDMTTNINKQYNREQQVSKASREFKILSKEIDVPVLLLSQLSRAVETRGNKKPQLSDLRESGSIEQDADVVTFIYRPEYYEEEGYTRYDGYGHFTYGVAYIIVAKQREGGIGEVEFCYNRALTKIWDSDERNGIRSNNDTHSFTSQPAILPENGNNKNVFRKKDYPNNSDEDSMPF